MATDSNDDTTRDRARQPAAGNGLFDSALAGSVRDSAQQIWLAGMGAFAKAQADGKSVFEALVKEGASLQQKTQAVAEEHLGDVAGKMSSVASDVQAKAGEQWGKLETLFEERTAKALQKLGVPSSKDLQAMQDCIDALTAELRGARIRPTAKSAAGLVATSDNVAPKPRATKKAATTRAKKVSASKRESAPKPAAKRAMKRAT